MTQKIPIIEQVTPKSDQVTASKKVVDDGEKVFDVHLKPEGEAGEMTTPTKKINPLNLMRSRRMDKEGQKVVLKSKPILDRTKIKISTEELALAKLTKKLKEVEKEAAPEVKLRAIPENEPVIPANPKIDIPVAKKLDSTKEIKKDVKLATSEAQESIVDLAKPIIARDIQVPALELKQNESKDAPLVKTQSVKDTPADLPQVKSESQSDQVKLDDSKPAPRNVVNSAQNIDKNRTLGTKHPEKSERVVPSQPPKSDVLSAKGGELSQGVTQRSTDAKVADQQNIANQAQEAKSDQIKIHDQPIVKQKNNIAEALQQVTSKAPRHTDNISKEAACLAQGLQENQAKQTAPEKLVKAAIQPVEANRKHEVTPDELRRPTASPKPAVAHTEKIVAADKALNTKTDLAPQSELQQKGADETAIKAELNQKVESGTSTDSQQGLKQVKSTPTTSKATRQTAIKSAEFVGNSRDIKTLPAKPEGSIESSQNIKSSEIQLEKEVNNQMTRSSEQSASAPEQLNINFQGSATAEIAQVNQNTHVKPKGKSTAVKDVKTARPVVSTKQVPSRRSEILKENYGVEPSKSKSAESLEENPADFLKQQLNDRIEVLKKTQESSNLGPEQTGNQNLHRNMSIRVNPVSGMVSDQTNSMAHSRTQEALFARNFSSEMVEKIREVVTMQQTDSGSLQAKFVLDAGAMGQLDVEFHQESNKDIITIMVDHETAKNDLIRILPQIEDNLQQRGFDMNQVEVEVRNNQEGGESSANQDRRHSRSNEDNTSSSDLGMSDDNLITTNRNYGYNTMEVLA